MATIALTRPVPLHRDASSMASLGSAIGMDAEEMPGQAPQSHPPPPAQTQTPAHVPNKHIPVCPPGPPVASTTPSPSPPPGEPDHLHQSLLFPPDRFPSTARGELALYSIDPAGVAAALDHIARQPLPDPSLVFPWFHGMHPVNHMQHAFFSQRRRVMRKTPCCLRGLTIVKADGDLNTARLKGAIAPDEFLEPGTMADFLDADPREGFSVRNFHIQVAKIAVTSDIVVYGDDEAAVETLGWSIAAAQKAWRDKHAETGHDVLVYNTFCCAADFSVFEQQYPHIVSIDTRGQSTGNVINFFCQERKEMYAMTVASEISHNVWLGPTPEAESEDEEAYDVLIECSDAGHLNPHALRTLLETDTPPHEKVYLDFPSSGTILPPTWSHAEADAILESCKWIYHVAHGMAAPPDDESGDLSMFDAPGQFHALSVAAPRPRKILIHCADGYTESTMLGLAYYSYSTGTPVPDAWLSLHTTKQRNFFAYPTDVALLTALAPQLLCQSPLCADKDFDSIASVVHNQPRWFFAMDGSFPSRILDYMYLGNLNHANNPDLLKALGITQILSVGEMAMWEDDDLEDWGEDNVCVVQGVQDNGIDPLTHEFERCLEFIDRGRKKGTATLVHCRVGVSRSATICIAEVMRSMKLSLPRAYCFVRARRLNVIIQPHLRFAYELLKWEEMLRGQRLIESDDSGIKRELEWGEIAREVALMNQPYVR